mgnify:CR=1 FL=1
MNKVKLPIRFCQRMNFLPFLQSRKMNHQYWTPFRVGVYQQELKLVKIGLIAFSIFISLSAFGQTKPINYSASAILQQLNKVNTLGSAMYIAAHPDDENTRLIAYLSNGMNIRTSYMAATRGDGGQNLIGPEIREGLGVIRTQELLAARRTDGGEQFFSRANDFGYSKDPDETFNVWDREEVLADFIWNIRKFRPDVLITRFSLTPKVTHGHHTASAILALEAFEKSGDPAVFPEQLKYVEPWQPERIFWNTSTWFFRRSGQQFDPEKYIREDVGQYNSNLGQSYTEISALSRSMHKSQGFGDSGDRGAEYEYFEQWGGDKAESLFGGIDTSWKRVEGSEEVSYYLNEARLNFDPAKPSAILGELMNARAALLKIPDQYWKEVKLQELRELILMVTGTYLEVAADQPNYTPGDSITVNFEAINRSDAPLVLTSLNFSIFNEQFIYNLELSPNQRNQFSYQIQIPEDMSNTNPYWLEQSGTEGMYAVADQLLRGLPENNPAVTARVSLTIDGQFVDYELPVVFKKTDPVRGEVTQPLVIQPKVMVNIKSSSLVFAGSESKSIEVSVIAGADNQAGQVSLEMPDVWNCQPSSHDFELKSKDEEQVFIFEITPSKKASSGKITALARANGETYDLSKQEIAYDHIPRQVLFPKAEVDAVKIDAVPTGKRIGYIMGAGDEVPQSLQQVGFQVDLLDKDQVTASNMEKYDAVILGVRAFNTVPWLAFKNQELFEYAKAGGNVIVQYNTSHRLVTQDVAPLPIQLSRDRVTVEESPVKVLAPKHDVLNQPFKITKDDFDGWVQERGLYFPSEWDAAFEPILEMNDPGESPKQGSLLVAKYGKGYYVYTGLSFFRELPPGVPGAYKLLINMISLGDK